MPLPMPIGNIFLCPLQCSLKKPAEVGLEESPIFENVFTIQFHKNNWNLPFFRWGCWLCNVNKWWGLIAPWHCSRPLRPRQSRDHRWRPDRYENCCCYDRDVETDVVLRCHACDDSLFVRGLPQIPELKKQIMNFPTSGKPRLARLWISSRGIIPQKANIEDVKKGFCEVLDGRCCFTTSEALLLPFTRINILHRPSQVWQFSMWAVPLFSASFKVSVAFTVTPWAKRTKLLCYYHCLVMRYS